MSQVWEKCELQHTNDFAITFNRCQFIVWILANTLKSFQVTRIYGNGIVFPLCPKLVVL